LIKVLEEAGQAVPKELGDLANQGSSYGGTNRYGSRPSYGSGYGNRAAFGNARY
jgi:hypothetical protein